MKTIVLPAFLCVAVAFQVYCFTQVAAAPQHGNNPTIDEHSNQDWQWYGVSFAGSELIAIDGNVYELLTALYGPDWHGTKGNANQCAELAVLICGAGQVCCFCYSGDGTQSCSFSCRDDSGSCEPCPTCGPTEPDLGVN